MSTLRLASIIAPVALVTAGCLGSPAGEPVGNADLPLVGVGACPSLAQIDDACPADAAWKNHGQYVSCVAHYLNRRVARGDLTEDQRGALQSLAAQSDVGKIAGAPGPSFGVALGDADGDGSADACASPADTPPAREGS